MIPIRRTDHVSATLQQIIDKSVAQHRKQQNVLAVAKEIPQVKKDLNRILLKDAIASGRFQYKQFGLFKEADDQEIGRIWVKKEIVDPKTGNKEEWLVVYTNDEEEMIRQVASEQLKKTAAPNPKDVPIAPGIKSKNITIDESGAQGTAKVTIEFTDVNQGLQFYQDEIATSVKPSEQKSETEEIPEEKPAPGPKEETGEAVETAPAPMPPMPMTGQASVRDSLKKEAMHPATMKDYQEPGIEVGDRVEDAGSGEVGVVAAKEGDALKVDFNGEIKTRNQKHLKKKAYDVPGMAAMPEEQPAYDTFGQMLTSGDRVKDENGRKGEIESVLGPEEVRVNWDERFDEFENAPPVAVEVLNPTLLTKWATPTIRKMTREGALIVDIIKESSSKGNDYHFINEKGQRVALLIDDSIKTGVQIMRPDTKQVVRVGNFIQKKFADLKSIAEEIVADMDIEIPGTVEDAEVTANIKKKADFLVRKNALKEGKYTFDQLNKLAYEEDYDYYHDNFTPEEGAECEDCGQPGAKYYNAFGQRLNFGGFDSDKLLCDHCAEEAFKKEDDLDVTSKMKKKAYEDTQPSLGYRYRLNPDAFSTETSSWKLQNLEQLRDFIDSKGGSITEDELAVFVKGETNAPGNYVDRELKSIITKYLIPEETFNNLDATSKMKKKADFSIGDYVGYHGREGKIVQPEGSGFVVHFDDVNEEIYIDAEELREQNSSKYDNEFDGMQDRGGEFYQGDGIVSSLVKEALDISDQIAPMSWSAEGEEEAPMGAGPSLPPKEELQSPNDPSQAQPVYDSAKDTGPSFQTTINPGDKSVTVKFVDNPEMQKLDQAVQQQPQQQPQPQPVQQPQQPLNQQTDSLELSDMNLQNEF